MRKLFILSLIFISTNIIFAQSALDFVPINIVDDNGDYLIDEMVHVDIDNDGDLDLISLNSKTDSTSGYGRIIWHENVDSNQFNDHVMYDGDIVYSQFNYGDLDLDGDIDFAAVISEQDKLVWFKNNGLQEFDTITISDSLLFAGDIVITDYNEDGYIDVIAQSDTLGIYWFKGDSIQNFEPNLIVADSTYNNLVVIDYDNDGDLDIVGQDPMYINWYKNDGNENHTEYSLFVAEEIPFAYGYGLINDIAVRDFDNDGDNDILVFKYDDTYLLRTNATQVLSIETTNLPSGIQYAVVQDFNGDGDLDVLSARSNFDNMSQIYLSINGGTLNFTTTTLSEIGSYFNSLLVSDLTGNGELDFTIATHDYSDIQIHYNLGDNTFNKLNLRAGNSSQADFYKIVDFDSDGDLDIISSDMVWHEQLEDGSYLHHQIDEMPIMDFNSFIVEDIDSDGDLDIMYTISFSSWSSDGLHWYENTGDNSFEKHEIYTNNISGVMVHVEVEDLDQDGDKDLVVGREFVGLFWLENDGNQNYVGHNIIQESYEVLDLKVVDIDNDGDMDIVGGFDVGGEWFNSFRWFFNDGNQVFTSFEMPNLWYRPSEIVVHDFDSDGDLDVLSGSEFSTNAFFYENDGSGSFNSGVEIDLGVLSAHLELEDINNDGLLDLITQDGVSNIHIHLNDGNGGYTTSSVTINDTWGMELGDMDGDGDLDIVSSLVSDINGINIHDNLTENDYLQIQIQPFIDENENSILDSNEVVSNMGVVSIQSDNVVQTSSVNANTLYLDITQEFDVYLNLDTTLWQASDSLHRHIVIDSLMQIDSIIPIGFTNIYDVLVQTDVTGQWPRCNRIIAHNLLVQNFGESLDTGLIQYTLADLTSFVSSTPEPDSISGQDIYYNFSDFQTAQEQVIQLQVQLPLGIDTLNYQLNVEADTNETSMVSIAGQTFEEVIRCSYDPNDKQVFPYYGEEGYVLPNQELEYLIRFQNTGNDTAFTVQIIDTLDQALDISTFQLVSNSHPVSVNIDTDSREVSFLFEEVNLTDTITNEPGSHGFVKYKITTSDSLSVNTSITNTAYIYFDENDAIVTNTTENTVYDCHQLGDEISFNQTEFYFTWDNPLEVFLNEEFLSVAKWYLDGVRISSNTDGLVYNFNTPGEKQLRIILENELCTFDSIFTIQVIDNIGLSEFGSHIQVYPNPVSDQLNIDLDQVYNQVEISVVNNLGQVISENKYQSTQHIDVKFKGEPGLYYLKVKLDNSETKVLKILKKL